MDPYADAQTVPAWPVCYGRYGSWAAAERRRLEQPLGLVWRVVWEPVERWPRCGWALYAAPPWRAVFPGEG